MGLNEFVLVCLALQSFLLTGNCANYQSDGYEFAFAIPHVSQSYPPRVVITTPSWDPVQAILTIPGIGFEFHASVSRYQHASISIPTSARLNYGTAKHNKTVIVRSSDVVSVHGFDNDDSHGDGFYVFPSSHLGTTYRVVSYLPYSTSYPSFFCVSAFEAETAVNIKTNAGHERMIILKPYESFRFDGGNYEDLTGTVVQADKEVSVVSGIFTYVPEGICCTDVLIEMLPPEDTWQTSFVLAPFMGRKSGYVYRVLATNLSTSLTISNIGSIQIQSNEWYEGDVTGDVMISIISDQPVMVVQYMEGYYSESLYNGDPSMVLVPPIQSYGNNITFPVYKMTQSSYTYYINVIINCSLVDGLVFDDSTSMSGWDMLKTSDNTMCAVRGSVDTGVHSVGHPDPLARFVVSVYAVGISTSSSYAYPAGFMPSSSYIPPDNPTPSASAKPPPDQTPYDVFGLTLYCDGTNMTAIFNTSVVPFEQASDVHMLDSDCVAADVGVNQAMVSTSYRECQTEMEESDGHMIFRNALIGADDPHSPIIRNYVNLECRIERRHLVDTSYLSSFKTKVSFGNFSFTLNIYPDETYRAPYYQEDYPIDVKIGGNVYIAAHVISVNELDLFVDSCWTTPTDNPWHVTSYSLIRNGCADDETVVFKESTDSSSERFSFHAFGFKGNNFLVFVHCQLLVCDGTAPNTRCSQGCVDPPDASRMRRSSPALQAVVSTGPFIVREQ